MQTDPRFYRDSDAIVAQAKHFVTLAPNIIVKIPVTKAGIPAIEEATYLGISINATVCFSLPQYIAVAEAVERGLKRREREGKSIAGMGPVCTIMVGRLDDWLKVVADKRDITVDPGVLEWAGVAVFNKTYQIFRERGYRLRRLSAAFRNHMHWSEVIGGEVVISPPINGISDSTRATWAFENGSTLPWTARSCRNYLRNSKTSGALTRRMD